MNRTFATLLALLLAASSAFANDPLRQSTAVTVKLGPFVDAIDATTPETGLTISQADVLLSKNGAVAAQKNDATSATHSEVGNYRVPLNATDTNTLGTLRIDVQESGAAPYFKTFDVLPANVYDSQYGTSKLSVTADQGQASRYLAKYNAGLQGNMPATHSRGGKSTVDGSGVAVGPDERRYDGIERAIVSPTNWRSTGYTPGAQGYLLASGKDLGGGHLIALREDASNSLRILKVDDKQLTVREVSRTAWTSLPGGGGSVVYYPRAAKVIDGTIFVYLERQTSSVYDGITFVYTQDDGATWSRITTAAIDGGGLHMSPPASYGSSANTCGRGGFWCLNYTPHGGLDAKGRAVNPNRGWLTWFDYLNGGNVNTKGHDCGLVELTRGDDDEHWTIGVNRRVWSGYYPSQNANLHQHSLGMTGDGLLIANLGDDAAKWSTHAIEIDLENYETDNTIVVTELAGELKTSASSTGRITPQIFGGAPAPNGDVFMSADTWASPIMRIANMASASDPFKCGSPLFQLNDLLSGVFYDGWELFTTSHTIDEGWTLGVDGPKHYLRLISYDGEHWANMSNCASLEGLLLICGDAVVCMSSDFVVMAHKPAIVTLRPELLAPGADNLLHNTTNLYSSVAPTGTNAIARALWSGGRWIRGDNSAAIANAPKLLPPSVNDGLGVWLQNNSTSSYEFGWLHAMDVSDTAAIGTEYVQLNYYIANLGTSATGKFSTRIAATSLTADGPITTGLAPDRNALCDDPWTPGFNAGNPTNNPSAARLGIQLFSGPSTGTSNVGCDQLVVFSTCHLGQRTSWPTARDSTGNAHEKEAWQVPPNPLGTDDWKTTFVPGRHELQATIDNGYVIPDGDTFGPEDHSLSYRVLHRDAEAGDVPLYELVPLLYREYGFVSPDYVPRDRVIDIDTPEDLRLAEKLFEDFRKGGRTRN